jgi:hypothetical protein
MIRLCFLSSVPTSGRIFGLAHEVHSCRMRFALTLTVTTTIQSGISSSAAAPGSAADVFGRANPAAQNSFAAALGATEPSTPQPSNEAVASTSLTSPSGSPNPADKAAPNSSATTKGSQKNSPLAASSLNLTAFLPVVALPLLSAIEISLGVGPPATRAAVSSPTAGSNLANTGATRPSQVPQGTAPGFAPLSSSTLPLPNTDSSMPLRGSALTLPSAGLANDAESQAIALPAPILSGNPAQPAIMDAPPLDPISSAALLETQNVPSLTGVPQNVDPSAAAPVTAPSTASLADILTASHFTDALGGTAALPSKIALHASLVSAQPQSPADNAEIPSASTRIVPSDQSDLGMPAGLSPVVPAPPVPQANPKPSAGLQPSPATLDVGAKPNPSPPTLLSALHALVENAMARSSNPLQVTPTPSNIPLAATPPVGLSTGFSVVSTPFSTKSPSPPPVQSFNFGSNSGPSAAAANPLPSSSGVQPTGGTANNSQSDTSGSDTPDPSAHKGLATTAAPIAGFPAAAPQPTSAGLADPPLQAGMQGPTQGAVQGAIQGTIQGTAAQPITNSSAHKSDSGSPVPDSPPNLPSAGESPATTNAGPVQMAQMVNRAAQSEMRIGLNTSAFGNVEVHTVVHANEVGIQIGSERGDLRSLLANDISGIANTLQQQNLRLNQVNFHQPGFAFSNQMSSGGDAQPRSFASRTTVTRDFSGNRSGAEPGEAAPPSPTAEVRGLSVLA